MSTRRWPMVALTPVTAGQANAVAQCRAARLELQWSDVVPESSMLRFRVTTSALQMIVWVEAEAWLSAHWPDLEDVAWSQFGLSHAVERFLPAGRLLELQSPLLADAEVELVTGVVASNALPSPSPSLACRQGRAWIERAEFPAVGDRPLRAGRWSALSQPLDLHIARVSLPTDRLHTLRAGAVLLLGPLTAVARVGRAAVCAYDFNLETMTMTVNHTLDFLDDDEDSEDMPQAAGYETSALPPAPRKAAPGIATHRLSVTLEVQLCQLSLTIAELDALQPGAVFNLPDEAWKQVQLRANGHCLATGELVQVGEQLGVQLHHATG